MVDKNNKYTLMQRNQYNRETELMAQTDHKLHNDNTDYWEMFINPVQDWGGRTVALDFGCGTGRNVENLINHCTFDEVWGADISRTNIEYCKETMPRRINDSDTLFGFEEVSGVDLKPFENGVFSYVMSTIVLQHICVHEIRFALLEEMHRVLRPGGVLSIQMGFGPGHPNTIGYYENYYDASATNSAQDTRVDHPNQLAGEVALIGFKKIEAIIRTSWDDRHDQWIFVQARKP